jgi:hypothetical protein
MIKMKVQVISLTPSFRNAFYFYLPFSRLKFLFLAEGIVRETWHIELQGVIVSYFTIFNTFYDDSFFYITEHFHFHSVLCISYIFYLIWLPVKI